MKLPGPRVAAQIISAGRTAVRGGGPASLRLNGIGAPTGWIVPRWRLDVEMLTRRGDRLRMRPEVPVPGPWAWGYRAARVAARLTKRKGK